MSDRRESRYQHVSRRRILQTAGGLTTLGVFGTYTTNTVAADPGEQEWAFETGGRVRTSPTVVGGTVFVGSWDDNLYAVDAETGDQQWAFEGDDRILSAPTVADGTVFVGTRFGSLYAVDAETGEQKWIFSLRNVYDYINFIISQISSNSVTRGTAFSSPTVADGTVFVGSRLGSLYAVDVETGTQQWAFETSYGSQTGSPTVVDGTVFIGSWDGNLYAVDAEMGTQQWAFETDGAIVSAPTVVDGTVFIGSWEDNLYAVDVETGDQQWAFEADGLTGSAPTVADGTVFVGSWDENLYAVDVETGDRQWAFETDGSIGSAPTVADGTVFVGSDDDNLYAIDAGVDGSSEGSRVMLGSLGHHGDWRHAGQTIDIPTYTYYTSWVRSNSELLALSGVGIGGIAGGGYLFRRRRAVQHSKQESAEESTATPTSADEGRATATEESEDDGASSVDELRSEAETALEAATTAREDSQFDEAVDAYTKAISHYQSALEGLNADNNETRTEIEESLDSTRDNLEAVRTRQEQRDDLREALKAGECSFQEGIIAYTEGGHTLAKIRFRQARGEFEQAVDLVENTDNDDLLNPPIEVSVQPDSELASTTLGELPPIPEAAVTKLADAGVETISDLESSDESPWPPAVVEPLVAEEIITDDAVAMLTLLSWWEDTDSYEFDTAAAISRRRDQAGHGFNLNL